MGKEKGLGAEGGSVEKREGWLNGVGVELDADLPFWRALRN